MNSVLRLYLMTSRGNHSFLRNQLYSMGMDPKFDEYLHAFYMNGTMKTLFDISFHSKIVENLYVQIGQPFLALGDHIITQELQKLQFKNYLPLERGLIDQLKLSLIVRESADVPSENILTVLLQQALDREIVRKEYFQKIINPKGEKLPRDRSISLHQIREIVQRKWAEEDLREQLLLENNQTQPQLIGNTSLSVIHKFDHTVEIDRNLIFQPNKTPILSNQGLLKELPFNPELIFYIRKNKGRILMKTNKQPMYKHGWKKTVGLAPMKESLAASILQKTNILAQKQEDIVLWDPFCGSGTIPLVAASIFGRIPVRTDYKEIFNWHHWKIFKEQYLSQYFQNTFSTNNNSLRIIASDSDSQTLFYTLNNVRRFLNQTLHSHSTSLFNQSLNTSLHLTSDHKKEMNAKEVSSLLKNKLPIDEIYELTADFICIRNDFEEVFQKLNTKVNIVTNLPYTQARSKQTTPLNKLISSYRRFDQLICDNKARFENIFIIVNIEKEALSDPYHFLNISREGWSKVEQFENGGIPVGMFGWRGNKCVVEASSHRAQFEAAVESKRKVEQGVGSEQVGKYLAEYREKMRTLEAKWYNVPQHLKKTKVGWRRVKEKRRLRHLQAAYTLFARRRDQMVAFASYAHKRLELRILRRGVAWKKKNLRLLQNHSLQAFEPQLKSLFEATIQKAVQKKDIYDQKVQAKRNARSKVQAQKTKQLSQLNIRQNSKRVGLQNRRKVLTAKSIKNSRKPNSQQNAQSNSSKLTNKRRRVTR